MPARAGALGRARRPASGPPPAVLRPGRLEGLIRGLLPRYRRAHLTDEEFRYVQRRLRQRLGLRGRPVPTQRLPEILTPDELQRILTQGYGERPRHGLIVRTLFETGLRVSELVRLEVADVDFTERTIRVRQGKGGKDRYTLMTPDLAQQLLVHLDGRTRGALFESNRAKPYSVRMIQHIVKSVAAKAGVTKAIHPHTYRHSMATFLRNQGAPLDVVQLLLGHADPRTTQLYARLSLAEARLAYDRAMSARRASPSASPAGGDPPLDRDAGFREHRAEGHDGGDHGRASR